MKTGEKTLLVVNPAAGHGRGEKIFRRLRSRLLESIPGLDIRVSEYPGHAVEIGRRAAAEGPARILCLGGDGTPYEVINGLYTGGRPDRPPEIGLIPAGTGNSFLRDFGEATPEASLESILAGRRRAVDLIQFDYAFGGRVTRGYALNILGVGLIADILKLTNERLKGFGALGYSLAVLLRLAKGLDNRIELEADGRAWTIAGSALVVSNSKFTGGRMKIAPAADTADGRADLVVFREVNRREIVSIFRRVFSGSHAGHPKVDMLQTAGIAVAADPPQLLMADGELVGETPLRAKVLPGEITLLA